MPTRKRLTILGSGPAGLTAALYAARYNLEPLVIEGAQPGGQLTITSEVDNFPGFPEGILGPELMDRMREQAKRFGTEFLVDQCASVDLSRRPFLIKTSTEEVETDTLIICTGAKARSLGLESEQKLIGHGVSSCATCDGFFFKDKTIFVVGGGDAAMEEAKTLTRFARSVTIIHRRDTFRASKIMLEGAQKNPKIKFLLDSVVTEVLGVEQQSVTGIKVRNLKTGAEEELPAEGVFVAIGHDPNTGLFTGQLTLNENGYIVTDDQFMTSVDGVFAAGDVQDPRYRQAVTAAGAGCSAAMEAQWYLEKLEERTA